MKKLSILFFSVLAFIFASCGTTSNVPKSYFDPEMTYEEKNAKIAEINANYKTAKIEEQVTNGTLLGPDKASIVFGADYDKVVILQQNAKLGYKYYEASIFYIPIVKNYYYAFVPFEVGSELKLFYDHYVTGYISNTKFYGICGVDYIINEPGQLIYLDENDKEHRRELKALKSIAGAYKGTAWESVIKERIKEMKDEDY